MLSVVLISAAAGVVGTILFLQDGRIGHTVAWALGIWVVGMGAVFGYSWWRAAEYQTPAEDIRVARTVIDAENNGISRLADHYVVYARTPHGVRRVKLPIEKTRIERHDKKEAYVETYETLWVDDPSAPEKTPLWHLRLRRPDRQTLSHYVIVLPERVPVSVG
ncbi:MAG: hypothetical protein R6X33_19700 [Candidatus Brocadiia bacterium]|jgi:hypothetical protein